VSARQSSIYCVNAHCVYRDQNTFERAAASFTPINQNGAPQQRISPLRTLRARDPEIDPFSDVVHGDDTKAPKTKGIKRTSKGCTKSLAWGDYADEGALAHHDQRKGSKASPPKRRKSAPAKRAKSTKASTKTLTQFCDDMEDGAVEPPRDGELDEQQGSQLTTPPDSCKKKTTVSRTKSTKPKGIAKMTGPFKAPKITKPLDNREKESVHCSSSSQAVINYQGWTSTEDAVKRKQNLTTIANTTLNKLAVFRYQPSGSSQHLSDLPLIESEALKPNVALNQTQHEPLELFDQSLGCGIVSGDDKSLQETHRKGPIVAQSGPHLHEPAPPREDPTGISSDDSIHPNDGNFFREALWRGNVSSDVVPSDFVDKESRIVQSSAPVDERSRAIALPQHDSQSTLYQTISTVLISEYPRQHNSTFLSSSQEPANANSFQHDSNYDEPTSSETRALHHILNEVARGREEPHLAIGGVANSAPVHDGASRELKRAPEADDGTPRHTQALAAENEHTRQNLIDDSTEAEKSAERLPYLAPSKLFSTLENHVNRPLADVQVERSDTEDYDLVSRDVSEDFEVDEFDEGLDDADLLEMFSEPVVPDTQLNTRSTQPVGRHNPQITPLDILDAEIDDEFLMDDGDEEEMLKLPEPVTCVTQRFQAPESVQLDFANKPSSSVVYDVSLQFSPPKSQSSGLSPRRLAESHTDNHSTNASPVQRVQNEHLVLGEEEDRSFNCSNEGTEETDVQIAPGPLSEQQRLSQASKAIEHRPLSSPGPFAKSHTHAAQPPATQCTSESVWLMWDDSHEYEPLKPFARSDFPVLIRDRCPVIGLSAQSFLRTCFRIGEMLKEGARCHSFGQIAVIELFARVTFSAREAGTTKQHFQFADLWHDRPPFPNGVLINYKTTGLAESESKRFIGAEGRIARCLGRLKRDAKNATGWLLHIITIREADWEEVRWTKRIVSAGLVKSEAVGLSNL
jgi:hypothetical protein